MRDNTILHIPMSQFAHGIDENTLVFRLRTSANEVDECIFCYGDTACRSNPVDIYKIPMNKVLSDEEFDWYEVVIENAIPRVCYYFELVKGDVVAYYYADKLYDEVTPERNELYKLPFNRREDIADAPDWLKKAVVYNIFPDSFASGYRSITGQSGRALYGDIPCLGKNGGTISGIKANLDYIKEIGFNCIYLNPVFTAGEYHKYDLLDYYSIDPVFGSNEEFKSLVDTCHDMGIKVIIDGVFNHCGWKFFAFEDVVKNGSKSKYWDWFYGLKEPVIRPDNWDEIPDYTCFAYERLMPKLNTGNPAVQDYFCKVGAYWVREYGIDGWRLDVADEVNFDFWRAFRKSVKEVNPNTALIGEVWQTATSWLDGSIFDSCMNYDFLKCCKYYFAKNAMTVETFNQAVNHMLMRYKKNLTCAQLNLLDSHDTPRFLSHCNGDISRLIMAVAFQMTFTGTPSVFYGDENGFEGILEDDYRQPMRFDLDCKVKDIYRQLIKIRSSSEAFSKGEFHRIIVDKNRRVYAYERYNDNDRFVVAINNSNAEVDYSLSGYKSKELLFSQGVNGEKMAPYGVGVWRII